ncbi:MAG: nuclear transport factor 2 family protein [Gemmatimonadaceae bacterium]
MTSSRNALIALATVIALAACAAKDETNTAATDSGALAAASASATAAAPDSEIVRLERSAWDAVKAKDGAALDRITGSDYVSVDPTGIMRPKAGEMSQMLATCETRSYSLSDFSVRSISADVALVTYKGTIDQTCGGTKAPSPANVASVWQRRNGAWQVVLHTEAPAMAAPAAKR